jgi:ABC-type antimicrobial peptide transport system permease subunit
MDRRYVEVSDSFCYLVGYRRGELIGKTYDDISAPSTNDIRMALGADRNRVFRTIVSQGIGMVGAGLGVGTLAAFAIVRLLPSCSHLLYGVGQSDPLMLLCVSTVLPLVAVAACYLPARRAMRTDPMNSLRCE